MIGHWPDPYPGEVLYSVAARYRLRLGYPNAKDAVADLFGPGCALATVELPRGLDHLVSALPPGHLYPVERLIEEHTAFPLYAPFLPTSRGEQVHADLRGAHGAAALLRAGVVAGGVPALEFLRSCPLCDRENEGRHGEAYWHRLHQLAGVEVCPVHDVFLEESDARRRHARTRHGFVSAQEARRPNVPRHLGPGRADAFRRRLAGLAAAVLDMGEGFRPGPRALHQRYLHAAIARGLASPAGGGTRREPLHAALEAHCPPGFLCAYGMAGDWPERLLRSPRAVQAPLHHLVLMDLLGLCPASLAGADGRRVPAAGGIFGTGPWPCYNPVCARAGQAVVAVFRIERGGKHGVAVGVFRCPECGFAYARRPPGGAGPPAPFFVRDYGARWQEALGRLWADKEVSLRAIARALHADPLTIKRHALDMKLPFPRRAVRPTELPHAPHGAGPVPSAPETLAADRDLWRRAVAGAPVAGVKALRARHPALYARLYRRDRPWLVRHCPSRVQATHPGPARVDWPRRDAALAARIADAAPRLRQAGADVRPRQVSFLALAREIGAVALVSHHSLQLPHTVAALRRAAEGREDYARRRIGWAADRFAAEVGRAHAPAPWQIARRAGLRADLLASSEGVRAALGTARTRLEAHFSVNRRTESAGTRAA